MNTYRYLVFLLIVVICVVIVLAILRSKRKNKNASNTPAMEQQRQTPATSSTPTPARSSTPTSGGTSRIFVNGGLPSSGNKMGTLTVDGKSLPLLYTDAPIEITVPAGRHHVVVEGGILGDARIDRVMELGIMDVWTIDMPGAGDEDVIRHQVIRLPEYRKALSEAGFQVTKKSL